VIRAILAKACFGAIMVVWLVRLGWPTALGPIVLTFFAGAAFFAWAIAFPSSRFLVPSVARLPETDARAIAFTFDDGPDPSFTPKILEVLKKHDAKATFFVVGERADAFPELVRSIAEHGHAVGSHSYSHDLAFHARGAGHARREVLRGVEAVGRALGTRPKLFRPPQGVRTPFLRDALSAIARDEPLVCVTWTVRGFDAMGRSSDKIVDRLASKLEPRAIVALHDGGGLLGTNDRSPTVEALDRLLTLAGGRGLSCVSLAHVERA